MHIETITRTSIPQPAGNLLGKAQTVSNLRDLIVAGQEVSDLLLKADTHDNN
ncbi:MAG TPA: hypothetical protein QF708_05470 [Candidatus Poseidoniia archaeon]|nr:hypothetical protein [Candidatus Poseidoniia archaeon]